MIVVVSGLPRSGTSMMMQMLQAGGMEVLTDHLREADANNPRGYWEFEAVKRLREDASWLHEAEGKAVKIVAPLLAYLPPTHVYRALFMERDLVEVLQSQSRMLERMGHAEVGNREALAHAFGQQLERTRRWLAEQPHIQTLYVPYLEAIRQPRQEGERVNAFLGGGLDVTAMGAIVDAQLYRERSIGSNG